MDILTFLQMFQKYCQDEETSPKWPPTLLSQRKFKFKLATAITNRAAFNLKHSKNLHVSNINYFSNVATLVQTHFTVQETCQSHSKRDTAVPVASSNSWRRMVPPPPPPPNTHTHSRELTDSNIVTIKHSPLSSHPPSPTLVGCHLIDL